MFHLRLSLILWTEEPRTGFLVLRMAGWEDEMVSPTPPLECRPLQSLSPVWETSHHTSLSEHPVPFFSFLILRLACLCLLDPTSSFLQSSQLVTSLPFSWPWAFFGHAVNNWPLFPQVNFMVFLLPFWLLFLVSFKSWCSSSFCSRASFLPLHLP